MLRWDQLCHRYLPINDEHSLWRYSRLPSAPGPDQGWKLHLAATVLSATEVLERLGPFLHARGVLFKGPRELRELSRLNSGVRYGYTQVGKAFTVYPSSEGECVEIAKELHELTAGLPAPSVPFDGRYCPGSLVFYRYGSFKRRNHQDQTGRPMLVITDPDGNLVPDSRETVGPAWAVNPFPTNATAEVESHSPLGKTLRVIKALNQRGKGGVYEAVDFSAPTPRLCILKEGRRHGEVTFDGRDGRWRVKHDKRVLRELSRRGIRVPEIYSSFEVEENFYLVTEHIEGPNLEKLLRARQRRLPIARALQLGLQVAQIVSQVHSAGWVWRDCKPANLILDKTNSLRPIDFESACKIGDRSAFNWGTQSFLPLDFDDIHQQSDPSVDLYALGVVLYYLLTGKFPDKEDRVAIKKLRPQTPQWLAAIVEDLMNPVSSARPSAQITIRRLNHGLRLILRARAAKRRSDLRGAQNGSEVNETIDANRSSYDFSSHLKAESLSPRPM